MEGWLLIQKGLYLLAMQLMYWEYPVLNLRMCSVVSCAVQVSDNIFSVQFSEQAILLQNAQHFAWNQQPYHLMCSETTETCPPHASLRI